MKNSPLAAVLTCAIALSLGTPAHAEETGLLLEMSISKAGPDQQDASAERVVLRGRGAA
jgi:hypothetical protein